MTLFVGASTKAYLGYEKSLSWLREVREAVEARPQLADAGVVPFVIPSAPVVPAAVEIFRGSQVLVGAQDVSVGAGAFTGETPASMFAEIGASIAEIGHAERRALFHEDDAFIARKFAEATEAGLTVLLCVGEPTRDHPDAATFCFDQVAAVVPPGFVGRVLVAYEPIWAIGAEKPAPADHVLSVVDRLRELLADRLPTISASILYGGSAGPGLLEQLPGIDGLFLGRFAHSVPNFAAVLDEAASINSIPPIRK